MMSINHLKDISFEDGLNNGGNVRKKNYFKIPLLFIALITVVFTLAACAGEDEAQGATGLSAF